MVNTLVMTFKNIKMTIVLPSMPTIMANVIMTITLRVTENIVQLILDINLILTEKIIQMTLYLTKNPTT